MTFGGFRCETVYVCKNKNFSQLFIWCHSHAYCVYAVFARNKKAIIITRRDRLPPPPLLLSLKLHKPRPMLSRSRAFTHPPARAKSSTPYPSHPPRTNPTLRNKNFALYPAMTTSSGAPSEMSTISLMGNDAEVAVMKLRRFNTVVPGGKSYPFVRTYVRSLGVS